MDERERLVATLKRLLKRQGYTYRRIGAAIGLSEPSVKRLFSRGTFTLERLLQLAALLGMSLAELADSAEKSAATIRTLTLAQERELVAERRLLLVAACAVNGWSLEEMVATYRLTKPECLARLLRLDRLGLLTLLPGDRIRLNISRDFDWLPGGPIERFFRREEKEDFLASDFARDDENFFFAFGMLTAPGKARLQAHLRRLRDEFAELHREGLAVPLGQRTSACLMVAQREWEPRSFAALRRKAPAS